jgi:very-short-patch-repair endonuclease
LALTSAALKHGWAVKSVPDRPHLLFSNGRRLPDDVGSAVVHRGRPAAGDIVDGVTSKAFTLLQCMRRLPFDEALCVADSALRAGYPRQELLRIGESASGPGSPQIRRVSREASGLSANVFETTMRAEVLDILTFRPRPQVTIRGPGWTARADLADERLGIVLEADSFEWHGDRAALSADARRYDLMVAAGWTVLRFSYEHVMTQPEFVRRVTTDVVVRAERMHQVGMRIATAA